MPGTTLAAITAAADGWEADRAAQDSAEGTEVGKRALLTQIRGEIMQLKRTIHHMVPNYCANSVEAKAAWATASHVQQAPSSPPPTP